MTSSSVIFFLASEPYNDELLASTYTIEMRPERSSPARALARSSPRRDPWESSKLLKKWRGDRPPEIDPKSRGTTARGPYCFTTKTTRVPSKTRYPRPLLGNTTPGASDGVRCAIEP